MYWNVSKKLRFKKLLSFLIKENVNKKLLYDNEGHFTIKNFWSVKKNY